MFAAALQLGTFFYLKAQYEGVVITTLPFTPFRMLQPMTHRSLPGEDMTHCGFIFVYALCAACIKPSLQKLLGHGPPKSAVPDTTKMAANLAGKLGLSVD